MVGFICLFLFFLANNATVLYIGLMNSEYSTVVCFSRSTHELKKLHDGVCYLPGKV